MTEVNETRAALAKPCYSVGGMDAKAVARAAGVPIARINVWVQRGSLGGLLETGVRGRRRDIDVQTAMKIALFAQMAGFNVPRGVASRVIQGMTNANLLDRGFVVIAADHNRMAIVFTFPEIEDTLNSWDERGKRPDSILHPGRPGSFLVIDVAALNRRVLQAEAEWQESREPKS